MWPNFLFWVFNFNFTRTHIFQECLAAPLMTGSTDCMIVSLQTIMVINKCNKIMSIYIHCTVNPISFMENWSTFSCTICTREIIIILKLSLHRYSRSINYFSEIYGVWWHIPILHKFIWLWWSLNRWKGRVFKMFK